jgi:hypothetical protein
MKLRVVLIVWFSVLSVIALEIFFPTSAGAQTINAPSVSAASDGKSSTEVVFTTAIKNAYIGLQGGEYHPDMVQQSDLTVSFSNGVFVSLWGSTDFTSKRNYGKEADFILGLEKYFGGLVFIAPRLTGRWMLCQGQRKARLLSLVFPRTSVRVRSASPSWRVFGTTLVPLGTSLHGSTMDTWDSRST